MEPMFAIAEKTVNGVTVYYDKDGVPACCNVLLSTQSRICELCRNCCIMYVVGEDGKYTCSACGKFPRELLLT